MFGDVVATSFSDVVVRCSAVAMMSIRPHTHSPPAAAVRKYIRKIGKLGWLMTLMALTDHPSYPPPAVPAFPHHRTQ